jgi:hypothetical protein
MTTILIFTWHGTKFVFAKEQYHFCTPSRVSLGTVHDSSGCLAREIGITSLMLVAALLLVLGRPLLVFSLSPTAAVAAPGGKMESGYAR